MTGSEEARFCRTCGAEVSAGGRFCVACGTSVQVTDASGAGPVPVAEAVSPAQGGRRRSRPLLWLLGLAVAVLAFTVVAVAMIQRPVATDIVTEGSETETASDPSSSPDSEGDLDLSLAPTTIGGGTEGDGAGQTEPSDSMSTTTAPYTQPNTAPGVDSWTWEYVPLDDATSGGSGDQFLLSVVQGGPGLVAVGVDTVAQGDSAAVALWSTDGLAWNRSPADSVVFGDSVMSAVATGGPGLVAVGRIGSLGDPDAAVWWSTDGVIWDRAPHDETTFGGGGMFAVAETGPGLIAVGFDYSGDAQDAAVWWSTDGLAWNRVVDDEASFGGSSSQVMYAVAARDERLVAVGVDFFGGGDAVAWWSDDGFTWRRVPQDEAVFGGGWMLDAISAGPGFVAVGLDNSGDQESAVVWWSIDGLIWNRVPHDETVFGGARMLGIAEVGAGLVAVGEESSGDEQDAAAWWSADGLDWIRVPSGGSASDGGSMYAVVDQGSGFVAVGRTNSSGGSDAAVWVALP